MPTIRFEVEGEPIPQPRPRAFNVGGRAMIVSNEKKHPIVPFKQHVQICASLAYQGPPMLGPIRIQITFVMPRPGYLLWKTKPMPRIWHTARPDWDNLAKGAIDACKEVFWEDDSQIALAEVGKVVAAGDEKPRTIIVVQSLSDHHAGQGVQLKASR
jgi:Holliday junction resolvase RusA-like endonuclease